LKGTLYLIPTPIDERNVLSPDAFALLENACKNEADKSVFVVEDHRPGRRKWIRFGLPREFIDGFILYNEQNYQDSCEQLISHLLSGKNVYLMSDAGLPAFCDPGRLLVQRSHDRKIRVTATSFGNSVILALALSGFNHDQFFFLGFPPRKTEERLNFLTNAAEHDCTSVMMDTPYRLNKLLSELASIENNLKLHREYFLALDLNKESELLIRGSLAHLLRVLPPSLKSEFVLCCAANT